ncbi:DUF4232 domain-containing protein [Jiangella muralis]|uniref:DUF4232 domain-containing protein n=1 Tax=Jiangella muralis TaxID=702383 RepID=UPI00069EB653|nr:DUF4232 domain-containing protein [Jiangella muralis]
MPFRTLLAVVAALALAACGQDAASTGGEDPIVAAARALPGVDDVTADPDGSTLRVHLVHDAALGAGWAAETVDALVADRPETAPRLEVWLHPATPADAEIAVRAYPAPEQGDPVGDAYVLAGTPGVVRARFDGETAADVRVRDASDLAKVADVAVVQGVGVDVVRTEDGTAELAVADVPRRPAPDARGGGQTTAPGTAAPACDPAVLRLELTGADAALGSRFLFLAATNTGPAPCTLASHPSLGFRTLTEQPLAVTVVPSAAAPPVVVAPGGRAVAMLDWNAMPTAGNPDLTYEVLLAAGPGAPVTELPLTSLYLPAIPPQTTLDIVDGGEVAVTEWRPDGSPF